MILYRTCKLDHTSYGKFKWNGVGEITEAPDWDPDPEIIYGKGLHAIGNGLHGDYAGIEKYRLIYISRYFFLPKHKIFFVNKAKKIDKK